MTRAILAIELRLRARTAVAAAFGLVLLTAAVGALFPAFGDSIGNVRLPSGVSNLIGGSSFATITGWMQVEVVSVYGPLVVSAVALSIAVAATAGDEEQGVLALVLAHPVGRTRLLLAKAAAVALLLAVVGAAVFLGLLLGVAFAGGGIAVSNLFAVALHLVFFGLAVGATGLALGAATGRRSLSAGVAAAIVLAMYLVNGLAPLVHGISWLRYATFFHYYEGQNQLVTGVHPASLGVLAAATIVLLAVTVAAFARRDLRR